MFTGLVEQMGRIHRVTEGGPGIRLEVEIPAWTRHVSIGESIAVNGCCLTVVDIGPQSIGFDVGPETLSRTNLGQAADAGQVNLERSLKVGDVLGGHLVTGHVDALGELIDRYEQQSWSWMRIRVPNDLTRQMAPKGSVAVDGVSLTLVEVSEESFLVQLIPHTLSTTTLGSLREGRMVNVETDILAKYVEAQLKSWSRPAS